MNFYINWAKSLDFDGMDKDVYDDFVRISPKAPSLAWFVNNDKLNKLILYIENSNLDKTPHLKAILKLPKDVKELVISKLVLKYLEEAIKNYNSLPDELKKIINSEDVEEVKKAIEKLKEKEL